MDGLRRELETVLRAAGASGSASAPGGIAALVEAWPTVVGAAAARAAWPARLGADGTLHVATTDAVWAQELSLLQEEIMTRLRAAVPDTSAERLRFATGALPPAPPAPRTPSPAPVPTPDEEATATGLASAIEDPELRETVRLAARASLAARRGDQPV